MDDLIRAKIHEALDVVRSEGDIRTRVINSLPAGEHQPQHRASSPPHWSAGVVAAFLAIAVVAGLLYSNSALGQRGGRNHYSPASKTNSAVMGQLGTITKYLAPPDLGDIGGLVQAPDGSVWFTASGANGVGNIVKLTTGGTFVEYPLSSAFTTPIAITFGPDGNIWFTETVGSPGVVASQARFANVGRIGTITPSGGISEYGVSASVALLVGIVTGPDHNLWAIDRAANQVLRVTVSGLVKAYQMPTPNSEPNSIAVGPDGNLWITEIYAGELARMTTSGIFTEFKLPGSSDAPVRIAAGPDGNLWVTEAGRFGGGGGPGKVAKVTTSGDFIEYLVPEKRGVVGFRQPPPGMIVVGPDNNLWFSAADNLDMVTTSGTFTQYVVPQTGNGATSVRAISAGLGGKVWFTTGGQPRFRPQVGELVAVPSKA